MSVLAVAPSLQATAALLAALAGAWVLAGPAGRQRAVAMALAGLLSVVTLASVAGGAAGEAIAARPLVVAGAGVLALALLVACGLLLRRFALALPLLIVAALPFRVPLTIGDESASLLLPLYAVLAAGVMARLLERDPPSGDALVSERRSRWVLRLLAASVVLYALQAYGSTDTASAAKDIGFFYVPFAVLLRLLADQRWDGRLVTGALRVTVGLGVLFAAVGIFQWATRTSLLNNEKVLMANELKPYFRVNSLFFDPNIYGRYLTLVALLLCAVLLWTRARRTQWLAAGGLLVLWAGLVPSLSMSSFAALTAGLAALGALRWRALPAVAATGAALAVAAALLALAPSLLGAERGLNSATSGRGDLIVGGLELWRQAPLTGHGSGSFAERYRAREGLLSPRSPAESHTIPVTVLAEQGLIGLIGYVLLIAATLTLFFNDVRRRAARAGVAAAYVALLVHTLVYAAFLEDPLTWALIAAALALRRAGDAAEPIPPLPPRSRRRADAAAPAVAGG